MAPKLSLLMLLGCVGCWAQPQSQASMDAGGLADAQLDETAATACSVAVAVFSPHCTGCHHPMGQSPDLSFENLSALVASNTVLIASDAEGSLLYRKMAGTQAAGEGGVMPPGGTLGPEVVAFVRRWIDEGATTDCETPTELPEPERYHEENFAQPELHGDALKFGPLDCRDCHGTTLEGDLAPSCDNCHEPQWRTTCTFCHGGTDNMTGAPPRDLDGDNVNLSFAAHSAHVQGPRHPAYDCTTCHQKPEDVLSVNHIFDATRGTAEVDLTQGLSAEGRYEGQGACSNLYCHGNGRAAGDYDHNSPTPTCDTCHAGPEAGRDGWARLSGEHEDHLREGILCNDCHGLTVSSSAAIVGPDNHVNGFVDLQFSDPNLVRNQNTCNGTCHMQDHNSETW